MKKTDSIRILGRHPQGVNDLLLLPDGEAITAGADGTLRRWKIDLSQDADADAAPSKPLIHFPKVDHYKSKPVQTSALSIDLADGVLACGMRHNVVELRHLKDGSLIRPLDNPKVASRHPHDFCRVMFNSADATQLIGSNRSYVNVWDTLSGKILWSDHQFSTANTASFVRNGSRLLIQEWDPWLHVLEWPGGKKIRWQYELMESSFNFLTVRAAPPGLKFDFVLATLDADGGHVVAMNIDKEASLWQADFPDRQHDVDIAADGKAIVTGGEEGTLRILSSTGKEQHAIDVDTHPRIGAEAAAFGPAKSSGMILTTNDLDDEFFPPTAIHRVKLLPGAKSAIVGLAGGLVLRLSW